MRAVLTWLLATKRRQNVCCGQSLRRRRRVNRPLKTNAGYGPPIPSASRLKKPCFSEDHFSGVSPLAEELATLKDEDFDLVLLGLTTPISTACSQELSSGLMRT